MCDLTQIVYSKNILVKVELIFQDFVQLISIALKYLANALPYNDTAKKLQPPPL